MAVIDLRQKRISRLILIAVYTHCSDLLFGSICSMPPSHHLCAEHTCKVNSDLITRPRPGHFSPLLVHDPLPGLITHTTSPLPVAPQNALFHPTGTRCTSHPHPSLSVHKIAQAS